MNKIVILIICIFLSLNTLIAEPTPKNVIVFIGDGMGFSIIDLSRIILQGKENYLNFETVPTVGIAKTYCANNLITDSAAAGTALACGQKTNKGYLGLDTNENILHSLVDICHNMGKSTGVVTNVTITHATPSAYLAHINKRNERKIAEQYLKNTNYDLVLGGGWGYFLPSTEKDSKRNDNLNLLQKLYDHNFNVALNKEDLIKASTENKKLIGMFAPEDLPYRIDRPYYPSTIPTIVDMTKHAIQFLSKNENGFFLMVEAGKIDWAMHAHDAGTAVQEIADLQEAYQVALDFLAKNPDTLIIVTADHETSGCALGIGKDLNLKKFKKQKASAAYIASFLNNKSEKEIKKILHKFAHLKKVPNKAMKKLLQKTDSKEWYSPEKTKVITELIAKKAHIGFTTPSHSGQSVGVYATGAGHNAFSGVYENFEIAKKIIQLLQNKKGE